MRSLASKQALAVWSLARVSELFQGLTFTLRRNLDCVDLAGRHSQTATGERERESLVGVKLFCNDFGSLSYPVKNNKKQQQQFTGCLIMLQE